MTLMAHLTRLSRYHQWAGETLYQQVAPLTDTDYRRAIGLFFGSIHGTLNHLLLAEQIWWGRIQQQPIRFRGLDQEVLQDREQLRAAIAEQALRWQQLLHGQPALYEPISYRDSKDQPRQLVLADILLHVFNHGSHHRGQISSGLTMLGARAPEMDLLYYLLPRPDEQLRDTL